MARDAAGDGVSADEKEAVSWFRKSAAGGHPDGEYALGEMLFSGRGTAVDEVAAFPSGEHDDLVDSTTLALMRFRQGGFLRLPSDEPEEERYFKSRRRGGYY